MNRSRLKRLSLHRDSLADPTFDVERIAHEQCAAIGGRF